MLFTILMIVLMKIFYGFDDDNEYDYKDEEDDDGDVNSEDSECWE